MEEKNNIKLQWLLRCFSVETLAIPFIVDSTVINCCVFVINNAYKKIELQNMYNIENIVTK